MLSDDAITELPIVGYLKGRIPTEPCIEIVSTSYTREWYWSEKWGELMHRRTEHGR